jgi:hypothetical protein
MKTLSPTTGWGSSPGDLRDEVPAAYVVRCPEQQALSDAVDSHDDDSLVGLGCADMRRLSASLRNPHQCRRLATRMLGCVVAMRHRALPC